jgi:hypothetical protein
MQERPKISDVKKPMDESGLPLDLEDPAAVLDLAVMYKVRTEQKERELRDLRDYADRLEQAMWGVEQELKTLWGCWLVDWFGLRLTRARLAPMFKVRRQ